MSPGSDLRSGDAESLSVCPVIRTVLHVIRIQCKCGKPHDIPEQMIGRKIRCMHCQKVLAVKKPKGTSDVKPAGIGSLNITGTRECSGCAEIYFEDVEVCIKCGINLKTGAAIYASTDGSSSWSSIDPPDISSAVGVRGFLRRLLGGK